MLSTIRIWHKSRAGLLTFSILELILSYGAVSWAIDSGNPLLYLATIVLLFGAIQNFVNLARRAMVSQKKTPQKRVK